MPRCAKGTRKNRKTGLCEEKKQQKPREKVSTGEKDVWEAIYYMDLGAEISEKVLPACAYLYNPNKKFTDTDMLTVLKIIKGTRALFLRENDKTELWMTVHAYENGTRHNFTAAQLKMAKDYLFRRMQTVEDINKNNIDESAVQLTAHLMSSYDQRMTP